VLNSFIIKAMKVQYVLLLVSSACFQFDGTHAGGDNNCGKYHQQSVDISRRTEVAYIATKYNFEDEAQLISEDSAMSTEAKIRELNKIASLANAKYHNLRSQSIADLAKLIKETPNALEKVLQFDEDSEEFPFRCIYNDLQYVSATSKSELRHVLDYVNQLSAELE